MEQTEKPEKKETVFEIECPLCGELNTFEGERDEVFYCEYCGCEL